MRANATKSGLKMCWNCGYAVRKDAAGIYRTLAGNLCNLHPLGEHEPRRL